MNASSGEAACLRWLGGMDTVEAVLRAVGRRAAHDSYLRTVLSPVLRPLWHAAEVKPDVYSFIPQVDVTARQVLAALVAPQCLNKMPKLLALTCQLVIMDHADGEAGMLFFLFDCWFHEIFVTSASRSVSGMSPVSPRSSGRGAHVGIDGSPESLAHQQLQQHLNDVAAVVVAVGCSVAPSDRPYRRRPLPAQLKVLVELLRVG